MTLFVASLFLPYTVHFEVESSNAHSLQQDTSIGEIAELITQNKKRPTTNIKSSKPDISTDSTISIIQALSNSKSSSKNSTKPFAENVSRPVMFNIDEDDASLSTLNSDSQQDSMGSKNVVSVQEFFFNNPQHKKQNNLLSSSPLEKFESQSDNDSKNMSINLSGLHVSNPPSFTFVQPKQLITNKSQPVSASVSELSSSSKQEPSLSAMKVSRSGFFNNRRSTTHSAIASRPSFARLPTDSSIALYDDYESSAVMTEEDTTMDATADFEIDYDRVTPFGGFSRPDYKELLLKNNVFSSAPWQVVEFDQGNGSLKNAVRLARLAKQFDSVMWIGTLSMPSNVVPQETKEKISNELKKNYNSTPVYIKDEEFQGHYKSFGKQILWPIFHYQIPDNPKSNAFENHSWNDYEAVNRAFADNIIAQYKEGDIIWVHDYHLMLVPKMLREKLPNASIGFFLHISFPSSEVFRCLAQRRNILEGILGADCVCFQTEEYVRHFYQSCNRLLLADFDAYGIKYQNRVISVTHDPIGIDAHSLNNKLQTEDVSDWRRLVKERWPNRKLIVSRDKIDKIRGIKEKLLAYERFLEDNPEYISEALLIMICPRSRSDVDEEYETEVFNIVERVNSKTNNISDDKPIVVLNQDIDFEQYLALLAEADLFIVSASREGMNLTSHEFIVATQESHSPLILSEFVGSAQVLTKGTLLTNPYNIKQVASMIKYGLEMDPAEKLERWKSIYQVIVKHDSQAWIKECIHDIKVAVANNRNERSTDLTKLTKEMFDSKYKNLPANTSKRLFILNLGNLTSNVEIQGTTINPVQQQFINSTIANLANDPNNIVYVLSYLKRSDLLRKYRRINELGLISEGGGYIKLPSANNWFSVVDENEQSWMETVIDLMKSFAERLPSSYIEVEECTVRFHTEFCSDIDKDHKLKLIGELITHVNELYAKDFNLHANLVNGIVIVQEANLIVRALSFIMNYNNFGGPLRVVPPSALTSPITSTPEISPRSQLMQSQNTFRDTLGFVLVAGGNTPIDEEIYNYFNHLDSQVENRLTIKVGQDKLNSKAGETLTGINELLMLLSNADSK
ncbi:glycosyltransferase family 20 protein [[Candida] arabinofermentans NRRL YB-2248]|uniref:Glycosyltransferase family 20 protein n=1 Tax=[Candida] arabinofermentans NRRL YB-2248 TaxID=983967 RepID=A0A1E4T3S8_9ASCO|nr:glycosyltransferase family 20 protein [[Candida] arabinofermentans NRRL YB-2248]